ANIMLAQRFEFCLARRINSAIEARAIPIEQSVGSGGVMRKSTDMLEDLRSEIDQIDDALHDLLMQRAEVSGEIAKVKQARDPQRQGLVPAFRPAREAAILRRLLSRHKGSIPDRVMARIWREIIAASLRAQANFQLHVYAGDHQELVDLAHGHFGSFMPVRTHTRP